MNIKQALKKKKKEQFISSESLDMYRQNRNTLIYWLLINDAEDKQTILKQILKAKDWKVDKE